MTRSQRRSGPTKVIFALLAFLILVSLVCPPVLAENDIPADISADATSITNTIPYIKDHTTNDTLYGGVLFSIRAMTDEQKKTYALSGMSEDDVMGIVRDGLLFNKVEGRDSLHDQIEKVVAKYQKMYPNIDLRKDITNRILKSTEFEQYFKRYSKRVIPQAERVFKDIMRLQIANDITYQYNINKQTTTNGGSSLVYCCETPKPPQTPYTEVEYLAAKSGYEAGYKIGFDMGGNLDQMNYRPQHDDFIYIPFKNTKEHPYTAEWCEQAFKDGLEQGKADVSQKDTREQLERANNKLDEIHETTKEINEYAKQIANNTKPKLDKLDFAFKSMGTFGSFIRTGCSIAQLVIKLV